MIDVINDSEAELRHLWHEELFTQDIYPGFPFRPTDWHAIAFNRDLHGNSRMALSDWMQLLDVLRQGTTDKVALLLTPFAEIHGRDPVQPIILPLEGDAVVSQFLEGSYFPEFFLAGESRTWAVRGDSDFTIIGGQKPLMSEFIARLGGMDRVSERMNAEFAIGEGEEDASMRSYLKKLLSD